MSLISAKLMTHIRDLAGLPSEVEWVEFKENNADPEEIGEYISALSNSAALQGKPFGYLIWGVADNMHELVGTTFRPRTDKAVVSVTLHASMQLDFRRRNRQQFGADPHVSRS